MSLWSIPIALCLAQIELYRLMSIGFSVKFQGRIRLPVKKLRFFYNFFYDLGPLKRVIIQKVHYFPYTFYYVLGWIHQPSARRTLLSPIDIFFNSV